MSEELAAAGRILADQHSCITTEQAGSVGIGRQRCTSLVRQAIWERLDHGVYGPVGVPMTARRQLALALLLAPEGSLASHRCAADLLGVGGIVDPTPEITIPRGSSLRRPWLTVHESTDLHLADRCVVDGIAATGPRRLAMDLGSVTSPAHYRQTVRELRSKHRLSFEQMLHTYLRHKRSGRNGGAALRDWLDRYAEVDGIPESGLEQVVLDALLDAGLRPRAQLWVRVGGANYRLDLTFPERMIVIEVDGSQHEEGPAKRADAQRDAALEAAGWTVIRIKVRTFATDLARAIRTVLQASVVVESGVA